MQSTLNPVLTDVGSFCQDICTQLGLDDDLRFSLQIGKLNQTKIDHAIVGHFLVNLLSNAQKYTPKDGQITLEISQNKQDIIFRVSDTGIGVPEEDQAHLFDPFHRASNASSFKGTGLGLTIAKTCVQQHGGTLEFVSEVGKGSTFIVKIPRS
jgi:signal transduction histidine kinase